MNIKEIDIKNHEELNCKEIQKESLKLLSFFDDYCKENNITYFLSGGTLLGAVRHHGFIPWDDDLDLMMPRPEYEKLIKFFKDKRYKLSCCENDRDYNTPFARIWDTKTILKWNINKEKEIGIFADIFPIDGYPTNETLAKLHSFKLKLYRVKINTAIRSAYKSNEKNRTLKRVLKLIYRKSGNYYSIKMNEYAKKYSYEVSEYVGVTTTSVHIFKERNKKDLYEKTIYIPFENMLLPSIEGYDKYLKHLYGDYMKLPPESNRITEHEFKIYKYKESD